MDSKIYRKQLQPLVITPDSKIGEILEKYPELEDILIQLVPSFGKLKNPILRKTVGRVATVRQASEIGNISIGTLINRMREVLGQESWSEATNDQKSSSTVKPDWVQRGTVVKRIDARPMLERGEHPVHLVMSELAGLHEAHLLELISSFLPLPLIDMAKAKEFKSWTLEESGEIFTTYFGR